MKKNILSIYLCLISITLASCATSAGSRKEASASTAVGAKVDVDASAVIQTIPNELFGQNWNTYEKSGDGKDEQYNQEVKAMGASLMRFPGGGYASAHAWDDITCGGKDASWLIDMQDGIRFAEKTGTQLLPIINFGGFWCDKEHGYDEAIKKAAAWVTYMNVSPKAHPCLYWEIGNEIYYDRDKAHTDGDTYGKQFARFAKAMKAIDPSIKLGFNLFENREEKKLPWNLAALNALKASGIKADFYAVHSYPIWFPETARTAADAPDWNKNWYASHPDMDALILKNVDLMERYTKELDQTIVEVLEESGKAPYFMTEFRSVLELKFIEFVDAMYSAQVLLEMGRLGWKGSNIWALKNGYSDKTKADFGLLRTGVSKDVDDNPKNSPRPTWYVYPYLSKVFGRDMVSASSTDAALRTWASKDADGNLTVFLVNNNPDPKNKISAAVNLKGFDAGSQGQSWLLESAGTTVSENSEPIQQRRDIKINGVLHPDPMNLPAGKALSTAASFKVELPASSMLLIQIPARSEKAPATK